MSWIINTYCSLLLIDREVILSHRRISKYAIWSILQQCEQSKSAHSEKKLISNSNLKQLVLSDAHRVTEMIEMT